MIGVINYKAGNAPSVMNALRHIGRTHTARFVERPEDFDGISHVILPGVGSAGETMRSLAESGLIEPLERSVLKEKKWFLGICVGMQLLLSHSEEENADCLGWIPGQVRRFGSELICPQMGWNAVSFKPGNPLAKGLGPAEYVYFVNSYYALPDREEDVGGTTDYGGKFCSCIWRDNIFGTQFHAEKSGETGLTILQNFCGLSNKGTTSC